MRQFAIQRASGRALADHSQDLGRPKEKETVGDSATNGRELRARKGVPEQVRVHDFIIKESASSALWRL